MNHSVSKPKELIFKSFNVKQLKLFDLFMTIKAGKVSMKMKWGIIITTKLNANTIDRKCKSIFKCKVDLKVAQISWIFFEINFNLNL